MSTSSLSNTRASPSLYDTPLRESTSPSTSVSKKRKLGSGRGVASLTPDQLAKKRANDREAQRAIRERTKSQIETLEQRIEELTSQQPYQELQNALRQRDAAQAENSEMRRRLATVIGMIQPLVAEQAAGEYSTASQHALQYGPEHSNVSYPPDAYHDDQTSTDPGHQIAQAEATNTYSSSPSHVDGNSLSNNERMWQSSRIGLERDHLQKNLTLNGTERLSFNFLLDRNTKRPPTIPSRDDRVSPGSFSNGNAISSAGPYNHEQTPWTTLPKHSTPTCPLDEILTRFLTQRQQEANRTSQPAYPSVSSLLNPTRKNASTNPTHEVDPLSQIMSEIISKFPSICGLPEQVATLYGMFVLMRWMIHPTPSNYDRIPDWLSPRPSQLFTPHPIWIDFLPWPRLRDKLTQNHRNYPFENWFIPFTSEISINWPYEPTDCLLLSSSSTSLATASADSAAVHDNMQGDGHVDETPVVNPVFERHVMRLENWSVGRTFVDAFPELQDCVKVKADGLRSSK